MAITLYNKVADEMNYDTYDPRIGSSYANWPQNQNAGYASGSDSVHIDLKIRLLSYFWR